MQTNTDLLLDRISQKLHNIDVHVAKMQVDLQHHIRRSELLESQQVELQTRFAKHQEEQIKYRAWITMAGWIVATAISVLGLYLK